MNYEYVKKYFEDNDNFIIAAHESPDGDAIGSEAALFLLLKALNKKVRIINSDPTPENLKFLEENINISTYNADDNHPYSDSNLIILDTNNPKNTGKIGKYIFPLINSYIILDHHEKGIKNYIQNSLIHNISSTSEIIFNLYELFNIKINILEAKAMYTGIVFDTGNFKYPKTSAKTLNIASKLVELGIIPQDIYGLLYEQNSISHLLLTATAYKSLELHHHNKIAIQSVNKKTLVDLNATYEDATLLINNPLVCPSIKISILFKETMEGVLRCSLRSRKEIDIAGIAFSFGGGGHKTAAGFKCKENLNEVKIKLLDKLSNIL